MQVLLDEARDSYDENMVVELRSDVPEDLESNLERIETWIDYWKQNNSNRPPNGENPMDILR